MLAAGVEDFGERRIKRPGLLVRPVRAEGVENVCHGNDASLDGNIGPLQSVGVSRAVPLFMMVRRNGCLLYTSDAADD